MEWAEILGAAVTDGDEVRSEEHAHAAVSAIKQFGSCPVGRLDASAFRMPSFAPFEEWVRVNGLPAD